MFYLNPDPIIRIPDGGFSVDWIAGFPLRYPDANYVSSMDAWIKLVEYPGGIHKSLPDFNYNNPHQLTKLNNILKDEGNGIFLFRCVLYL